MQAVLQLWYGRIHSWYCKRWPVPFTMHNAIQELTQPPCFTPSLALDRWRSSASAKGTLTVHSCGLTTKGSPTVSVRATSNAASPLAGPWSCEG